MPLARLAAGVLALTALVAAGKPSWPTGLPVPTRPAGEPVAPPAIEQARIELGRRLFYDADLSRDGTMACATCHEQKHAFADGNRTHPGVTGEPGRRNVPGLANVRWIAPLTFADPAQTTLEAQVAVPVFGTHPVEMGMKGLEGYRRAPWTRRLLCPPVPQRLSGRRGPDRSRQCGTRGGRV
jgi:cytochrome c peroxidase